MSNLKVETSFKSGIVSLDGLTKEQKVFAVKKANETGIPLEEIVAELLEE